MGLGMTEQFTKERCKVAIEACQRLAALPQHPMSAAFWRGMERLWRERLGPPIISPDAAPSQPVLKHMEQTGVKGQCRAEPRISGSVPNTAVD